MTTLNLCVATDLHYDVQSSERTVDERPLLRPWAKEWLLRAIDDASADGPLDAIVLLGDLADCGRQGAQRELEDLADALRRTEVPLIVVPGNHDGDPARVLKLFGDHAGPHLIKGVTLYSFVDAYDAEDYCTRADPLPAALAEAARQGPVIALQHSPIFPDVAHPSYPYMPVNVAAIRAAYEKTGVLLSLSGHYHEGNELVERNGVRYLTCATLSESPFRFYRIRVEGRTVAVEPRALGMPEGAGLLDMHTHSHFGYCAQDVHPVKSLERARALGLRGIACVEHAGQIYLSAEAYWSWRHVEDPGAIHSARRSPDNRMAAFKNVMRALRAEDLRIGLEVECDCEGGFNLLEEDRDGWDVLLGAVHVLPSRLPQKTPAQFRVSFMKVVEHLLAGGITVLAHPFRIFHAAKAEPPRELYRPLARLLKDHGVAAEINFHYNRPEAEFYRLCAEEGTGITLGSDAHLLREVGALHPHLRLLETIGLTPHGATA